jgi:hypothetical protein
MQRTPYAIVAFVESSISILRTRVFRLVDPSSEAWAPFSNKEDRIEPHDSDVRQDYCFPSL